MSTANSLRWARRVHPDVIRRLYASDARGPQDEELVNEDHQDARDGKQEGDGAGIVPQLSQHADRGRPGSANAHDAPASAASTSARNAAPRSARPVADRSSSGVPAASRLPARRRTSQSHRSASSMT